MPSRKSKKQKQSRNISGLRNQSKASPTPTASSYNPTPPRSHAPSPEGDGYGSELEDDDDDLELLINFDSMKMNLQHEDEHYRDLGDDEDDEGLEEWSGFHSQDLADAMGAMIMDDDLTDLDWMPSIMRKELLRMEKMKTERPKEYKKGLDVMSKSARTQRRYQKAFRRQGKLTGFGFEAPHYNPHLPLSSSQGLSSLNEQRDSDTDSRKRSASVLSDHSMDHDICSEGNVSDCQDLGVIDEGAKSGSEKRSEILDSEPVIVDPADHEEEVEDWEAELEEIVEGPKGHVRDWADLRTDIKKHLKKHSKTLPLSQLNQLMIISNFATLRLKGLSRTQASIEIARQWHEGQGNWFARHV